MQLDHKRPHVHLRRSLLVGAVLALLLAAACSNSSDTKPTTAASGAAAGSGASNDTTQHVPISGVPGVSDTEIHFSSLGTNSNNPLGTCVLDCFDDGIKAYFDFRNSQGGIYGRKLVLSKEVDDELRNNQAKALEIISANDTFGTFSAPQLANGWADLAKAGIPTYVWAINPAEATGHPEIFGNARGRSASTAPRGPPRTQPSSPVRKKVATLGYGVSENSKQCADSSAESIEKYSDDVGGAEAVYTNDDLDFGLPERHRSRGHAP